MDASAEQGDEEGGGGGHLDTSAELGDEGAESSGATAEQRDDGGVNLDISAERRDIDERTWSSGRRTQRSDTSIGPHPSAAGLEWDHSADVGVGEKPSVKSLFEPRVTSGTALLNQSKKSASCPTSGFNTEKKKSSRQSQSSQSDPAKYAYSTPTSSPAPFESLQCSPVGADASTDWEYDNDKSSNNNSKKYVADWQTNGITRSEIEYRNRKKSGGSTSAASSVQYITEVQSRIVFNKSEKPPSDEDSKKHERASHKSKEESSKKGINASDLERIIRDALAKSNPSFHNRSEIASVVSGPSSVCVLVDNFLKALEKNPNQGKKHMQSDVLKSHRDYHIEKAIKQIRKVAEIERDLDSHQPTPRSIEGISERNTPYKEKIPALPDFARDKSSKKFKVRGYASDPTAYDSSASVASSVDQRKRDHSPKRGSRRDRAPEGSSKRDKHASHKYKEESSSHKYKHESTSHKYKEENTSEKHKEENHSRQSKLDLEGVFREALAKVHPSFHMRSEVGSIGSGDSDPSSVCVLVDDFLKGLEKNPNGGKKDMQFDVMKSHRDYHKGKLFKQLAKLNELATQRASYSHEPTERISRKKEVLSERHTPLEEKHPSRSKSKKKLNVKGYGSEPTAYDSSSSVASSIDQQSRAHRKSSQHKGQHSKGSLKKSGRSFHKPKEERAVVKPPSLIELERVITNAIAQYHLSAHRPKVKSSDSDCEAKRNKQCELLKKHIDYHASQIQKIEQVYRDLSSRRPTDGLSLLEKYSRLTPDSSLSSDGKDLAPHILALVNKKIEDGEAIPGRLTPSQEKDIVRTILAQVYKGRREEESSDSSTSSEERLFSRSEFGIDVPKKKRNIRGTVSDPVVYGKGQVLKETIESLKKRYAELSDEEKPKKKPSVSFFVPLAKKPSDFVENKVPEGDMIDIKLTKALQLCLQERKSDTYQAIVDRDNFNLDVKHARQVNSETILVDALDSNMTSEEVEAFIRERYRLCDEHEKRRLISYLELYYKMKKYRDSQKGKEKPVITTQEMLERTQRLRMRDILAKQKKEEEEKKKKALMDKKRNFSENLRHFSKKGNVNVPDQVKIGPRNI